MKTLHLKNQRGDTIVEVLIALAVISLVLAAAYAIVSRNVRVTQDTQEHNQAQQIVQQQVERLRAVSASDQLDNPFKCIAGSGSAIAPSDDPDVCSFIADGSAGNCSDEPCYHVLITKDLTSGIYEVVVSWQDYKGDTSKTSMVYGV